jgi:hypothetical protein
MADVESIKRRLKAECIPKALWPRKGVRAGDHRRRAAQAVIEQLSRLTRCIQLLWKPSCCCQS